MANINIKLVDNYYNLNHYDHFANYFGNNAINVEPQTRIWFENILSKDDIVFDIGANIGMYTILFNLLSKAVYAFEPTDTYDTLLLPNLAKNNIKNVITEKLALGCASGKLNDKIYKIWGIAPEESEYDFTTLDDYIYEHEIYPTFLKIDVDGYDYEVLLGSQNFLNEYSPVICVEVNYALHTRGYAEGDVFNLMKKLNYTNIAILDDENYIYKKIN